MNHWTIRLMLFLLLCVGASFAQQPINQVQIGGQPVSTGNGVTGTGTQRVTISSDNTAFSVNATLSAETTKNIGTVRMADGAGNLLTSNSTTPAAHFALDENITSILGTAPTTVGKLDVKGADGDVFVRQTTGSNLHVVTDSTSVVRITGNLGAAVDFAGQAATAAANSLQVGATFFTAPTTLTNGQASPLQMDSSGKLLVNCTGCSAGSTVALIPHTSGGLTIKHFVAAASDNATNAKAAAGQVYNVHVFNNAAYPVYLKLYNAAASPTGCGATNLVKVIGIQAGTEFQINTENGWPFATGISYCLTKGITDADDTAVLLSDATVDIGYN